MARRLILAVLCAALFAPIAPGCAAYTKYQQDMLRRVRADMRARGYEPIGNCQRIYVAPLHSPRFSYRGHVYRSRKR